MRVVLFDIDGTLLSSSRAGKAALDLAMMDLHGIADSMAGISLAGRTDRSIVRDLTRAHPVGEGRQVEDAILEGYLSHLPVQLRHKQEQGMASLLPGIVPILDTLAKTPGVAVGLLTGNIRRGAAVKLGHFGIGDRFDFGGFGDHHFDRDEVAREAWTEVTRRFGADLPPENILVIGDTPLDVQCARAIGAKVLAVATGIHTQEQLADCGPDFCMADLGNHQSVLEACLGA